MRTALILFATAVAIACPALSPPAAAQSAPAPGYQPRFEEAACPFEANPQVLEQLRCGYLVVPENRAAPQGRQLRLAVAILKSTSSTPRPDPIVFLHGGPGGQSIRDMPSRTANPIWNRLRADREAIFFDQRGTGYSEPEFCPEVTEEFFRITFLGLSSEQRSERMQAVLAQCSEVMRQQGVDLSQYNSIASAHDLQDLRRALGHGEWNLLGGSYGTRLGLEAIRTTPEGIRSAVFDSPAPPNAPQDDGRALFVDVVRRLTAACAADASCGAAYPQLEQRIWQTVEQLDRDPWLLPTGGRAGLPDPIVVDGTAFAGGLFQGLYRKDFIPLAPLFIEEVGRRNEAVVLAMVEPLSGNVRDLSRALNLAVRCYENVPFDGSEQREDPGGTYPQILERIGFRLGTGTPEECNAWHPFRAGPEQAEPVRSDIPTLVFTGEFDPVTHRSFGALAVQGLTNGHLVEVPAMGHGASAYHECTRSMLFDFFDDPTRAPDQGCISEEMEPVRFVTDVRVAPGVGRVASMMRPRGGNALASAALGLPLLVLLGSALGWPVAAGVSRLRRRERAARTPFERRAQWGAAAFTLLALGFAAGLAWVMLQTRAENPMILLFGLPGWAAPLLVIPWILLAGSIALVAAAALAWRRGAWTRLGRIHFTVVALAGLALAAALLVLGVA